MSAGSKKLIKPRNDCSTMPYSWWVMVSIVEARGAVTSRQVHDQIAQQFPEIIANYASEEASRWALNDTMVRFNDKGICTRELSPDAVGNRKQRIRQYVYSLSPLGELLMKKFVAHCESGANPAELYSRQIRIFTADRLEVNNNPISPILNKIKPTRIISKRSKYTPKVTPKTHPNLFRGVAT